MSIEITTGVTAAGGDQQAQDITRQALTIYEESLRSRLEPAHNGEIVAIHVDSEDSAVGRTRGDAVHKLRAVRPRGPLVVLRIGSEPEYGLANRFFPRHSESPATG